MSGRAGGLFFGIAARCHVLSDEWTRLRIKRHRGDGTSAGLHPASKTLGCFGGLEGLTGERSADAADVSILGMKGERR